MAAEGDSVVLSTVLFNSLAALFLLVIALAGTGHFTWRSYLLLYRQAASKSCPGKATASHGQLYRTRMFKPCM